MTVCRKAAPEELFGTSGIILNRSVLHMRKIVFGDLQQPWKAKLLKQ
jgi:hypothetical protein